MAHQSKSGTVQFALDISPDASLRFESLHQSMGLKTKAQTFEAILYFVSTKDKIDPAALQRMEKENRSLNSPSRIPDMKNGQIFAHKSTARGGLDLEYLDETSRRKVSLRERADMDQQIGKKLNHFTDYASKETLGQVHAGGFLHHSIRMNPDGTSTAPSQLSNPERKQRITEAWREHLAKFPSTAKSPVIAHRLVFSMSKEQHDVLTGAGINPDQVLHSTLKKVMRRFNERFHPNDSIGYAYGLHHDTANLHVHVAICPSTENGSYVGCSTSRSAQSRHKKQLDCIKSWFEIENSRWEKILSSPQKLDEMLSKRLDADKLVFSPKLNHLQMNALRCAQSSDSIRLQQLHQSIRNLEASLANKRRGLGAQRDQRFVSRLLGHRQSRAAHLVAKIGTTVERRSLREVQSLLFKLKRQYRTLHKRYSQIYGFSSYAHRNAISYHASMRQQSATMSHALVRTKTGRFFPCLSPAFEHVKRTAIDVDHLLAFVGETSSDFSKSVRAHRLQ